MLGIRTGKVLNNRLTSALLNVIQADPVHNKGKREVLSGDLNVLRGFEFKPNSPLSSVLVTPFNIDINRAAGLISVEIPVFDPSASLVFPAGATHARLAVAGVNLRSKADSDGFEAQADVQYSDFLASNGLLNGPLTVRCAGIDAENPLVVVVGIEFWQDVHGEMVSLAGGWCSSAAVVAVEFQDSKISRFQYDSRNSKFQDSRVSVPGQDAGVMLADRWCVRCWVEDGVEKTETIRLGGSLEADLGVDSQIPGH
jgi:hypothetical protein